MLTISSPRNDPNVSTFWSGGGIIEVDVIGIGVVPFENGIGVDDGVLTGVHGEEDCGGWFC